MKQHIFFTAIAATLAGLGASPAFSQSGEAAQVIFTNDKLTVIDAKGIERTVKQGEFIQPGERVLTPPGVIGQIRLPDGTLLGARPGSDIKLEAILRSLGKNVLVLNEGNVRVINVEPPKGAKPMPMDVVSPISTMHLTGGDGEAIHVKPGSKSNVESGTYTRLQLGTAVVRNDKGELPLPPMQPVFGAKLGVPLAPITFLPISLVKLEPVLTTNLFAPTLSTTTLTTDLKTISPTLTTTLTSSTLISPTLATTTTLTSPLKTTLGTAALVGTTSPTISPTLTPTYSLISPTIVMTAAIKPPPPPPPPPPKVITCKTCLFIIK
jgi:hypothetical protein